MPTPQTLVTFVTTLFVLLLATRVALGLSPVASAALSALLAVGLAAVVERSIPYDADASMDDITEEADPEAVRPD